MLANFSHRLSFAAEDQAEVKSTLLKLLQLIVENMGELSLDDSWLKGQTEALRMAAALPLTLRRLDEVERLLKDVLFKQKDAKGRAMEAQDELRKMLATFIERLSLMTDSSSGYQGKMEESVRLMEQARSLEDIAPVLKEVIGATRLMTADALAVRDELQTMREKTQATDAELSKLHQELDRVSAQALHDHLTGALNRKGLSLVLRDTLLWVLANPNHKPRLARVSATYSRRMSSCSLDSVMSGSSLSSSSSSAGFLDFSEAGRLKLPKKGTNTKGYSRPLLL